jgi:hypothetical protein
MQPAERVPAVLGVFVGADRAEGDELISPPDAALGHKSEAAHRRARMRNALVGLVDVEGKLVSLGLAPELECVQAAIVGLAARLHEETSE